MSIERKTVFRAATPSDRDVIAARWLLKLPVTRLCYSLPLFPDQQELELFLSHKCKIQGRIKNGTAEILGFNVSTNLRGFGIGERLFKGFVQTAVEKSATKLWSEEVSNAALGLRTKLLGASSLHFFDTDYLDASEVPISVDQARLSNERVEQLWLELADDEPAPSPFGIMVDLSTLDMSNWEPTHFIESTVPV